MTVRSRLLALVGMWIPGGVAGGPASLSHSPGRGRALALLLAGQIAGHSLAAAAVAEPAPTGPVPPRRVVSLNVCTDQLLIALAEPRHISAVSRFSRDPGFSTLAGEAQRHRVLRGTSEEVLHLAPDLVLASAFTRPELLTTLRRHRIPVETFAPAITIDQGIADIRRVAGLLGRPAEGDALVARIERTRRTARAELAAHLARRKTAPSVLQLQRRMFVSGRQSLFGDLLQELGAENGADRLAIASVGRVTLEGVLRAAPDILVLDRTNASPHDQGEAGLAHPALAHRIPPGRRLALDPRLFICAGPSLADAIDRLATGLASSLARIEADAIIPRR